MASQKKEDERIERTIRGLLRLPENRRCIDCNMLGPQYVCTNFLTFVCTNCSGVHREFNHRVKSVSLAKFSAEEVSALQAGGNERARQIYFKVWDPQRHSYPDGSNIHKLRHFIKHVYVDRKYTGEKNTVNLPTPTLNDKEFNSRKFTAYKGRSRSPEYEKRHERRYGERSSPARRSEDRSFKYYYEEKSPRYAQEISRRPRRSSAHFEVVDDRFRDDGHGSHRFSNTASKRGTSAPDFQKNIDNSCSPVVLPVRDILGESVTPSLIAEPSKTIDRKNAEESAHNQKITSSIDVSLIDFSPDTEPLDAETIPQTQQMLQSDSAGNWDSFRRPVKDTELAPSANTLESLLFGPPVPSVVPASNNMFEGPSSCDALSTATGSNIPAGGVLLATSVQQTSAFPTGADASTTASITNNMAAEPTDRGAPQGADHIMQQMDQTSGALNYQPWIPSAVPGQGPFGASAERSSQDVSKSSLDTSSRVASESLSVETKPRGSKELPADLFTASYSTGTAPFPGWQNSSPYGMGFNMQYHSNARPVSAFPSSARSTNPFDLSDERTEVQSPPFPSMASLQGALPNVSAASNFLHTSNPRIQSSGLMAPKSPSYASAVPPHSPSFASAMLPGKSIFLSLFPTNIQSSVLMAPKSPSYASALPPHSPSFASAMPPGAYMGLQVHSNVPPYRSQGVSGFGSEGAVFGSSNTTQHSTGTYSAPSNPKQFYSARGNPFG